MYWTGSCSTYCFVFFPILCVCGIWIITFFSCKVVEKLCRYHGLWKEGKTQQIQQEISSSPKTKFPQFVKQETGRDGSDASDNDSGSEIEEETNEHVCCNGHHEVMGQGKVCFFPVQYYINKV